MIPAKLNVYFAFFPYGSNGGTNQEHPSIRSWFAKTVCTLKNDPRVGEIMSGDFSDTPITMTRNAAVIAARKAKADVLVMTDSDQHPDLLLGKDPQAKPWWDSCFDFLYERKMKGQVTVIGAPYCGPPPLELPYIFKWTCKESDHPNPDSEMEMYTREEAAIMSGIQPCAGLPTGHIMFDMDIFEITDPKHEYEQLLTERERKVAQDLTKPWFYYEWTSIYQAEKASTEDVTCTRDMALLACQKLGYNPMYANWDAWAGHYKPKCVGKPKIITADSVNEKYRQAVLRNINYDDRMVDVGQLNKDWLAKMKKHVQSNGVPQVQE